jgi:hypothetical protein
MSQKTLISFYQKKQKKSKGRISDLLSGRAKRREISTSTPAVAEASKSAAAAPTSTTSSFIRGRGESEMEGVLITRSDEESQILPLTRTTKRRRTEEGREEQLSEGNFKKFQKISKNLIKIFYNM